MKTLRILAFFLCSSLAAARAAEPRIGSGLYADASLAYATVSDYDNAAGLEVAFGYHFDGASRLAVETGYFVTHVPALAEPDIRLVPLLLKCTYTAQLAPRWSATLGVAGGAVFERFQDAGWQFVPEWSTHPVQKSATAAAFGGEAGVDYSLSEITSLGVGATVLALNSTDVISGDTMVLLKFRVAFRF